MEYDFRDEDASLETIISEARRAVIKDLVDQGIPAEEAQRIASLLTPRPGGAFVVDDNQRYARSELRIDHGKFYDRFYQMQRDGKTVKVEYTNPNLGNFLRPHQNL